MSQGGELSGGGGGGTDVNTLTGDTGGAVSPDGAGNIDILGGDTVSVTGTPASHLLTIEAAASGYPITPYVVGPSGQAGYQSIQSALDQAVTDGTTNPMIWLQSGTYTEDLTFSEGATIFSYRDICSIVGTHTPPSSGTVWMFNFTLTSSGDIFSSASAGAGRIFLHNVATNASGFTFNLPNWTGPLSFVGCSVAATSSDDGIVSNGATANVTIRNSRLGGSSTGTMALSGGAHSVLIENSELLCGVSVAGSGNTSIVASSIERGLTLGGSVTSSVYNSYLSASGAAALTMSSSQDVTAANSVVDSDNSPSIAGAGAGTLTLDGVDFIDDDTLAGTLTLASGTSYSGTLKTDYTDHGVLLGQGAAENVVATAAGSSGQTFTGVSSADPIWSTQFVPPSLGFSLSAGTFSIVGANGSALSASNPGYVTIPSRATPGTFLTHALTSPQSFDDAAGTSDITGNLFNFITSVAVTEDVPFYVYAVVSDSDDSPIFMLCRVPHYRVSPTTIGTPSSAAADTQASMWAFSDITTTSYDSNPCVCVGRIRMRMDGSDDWTIQTLDNRDGVGMQWDGGREFTQMEGQLAADAGSTFCASNGGTAAVFDTNLAVYRVYGDGVCRARYELTGDGGTDGAGAVDATIALPFVAPGSSYGSAGMVGRYGGGSYECLNCFAGNITVSVSQGVFKMKASGDTKLYVNWADYTNAARSVLGEISFPIAL